MPLKLKEITIYTVLCILTLAASFVFWGWIGHMLNSNIVDALSTPLNQIMTGTLSFIVLTAIFIVITAITLDNYMFLVFAIFTSLPILFFPFGTKTNLIFLLLTYGSFSLVALSLRYEIKIHTKLALAHIFSPKLTVLTTIISLIIAAQFFVVIDSRISDITLTIPPEYIENVLKLTEPFVKDQLKVQQEALEQTLIESIDQQLPFLNDISYDDKVRFLHGELPESIRSVLKTNGFTDSQIEQLLTQIKEQTSIIQTGSQDDSTQSAAIQMAKRQVEDLLNNLLQKNKSSLPWLVATMVFLTLTSFGVFIKYLSIFLAKIILVLMGMSKLIKKDLVQVTAERYVIDTGQTAPSTSKEL